MKPDISVIITTHNRPIELARAVASVVCQSVPAKEIIVVNDGDALPEQLVSELGKQNVKLHSTTGHQGASVARNVGARKASADWICFLDDDDEFLNDRISTIVREADEAFDVLVNEVRIFYPDLKRNYNTRTDIANITLPNVLTQNNLGGVPKLTIRREFFLILGGFDETLRAFEDYDLNIRIVKEHGRLKAINEVLSVCNYYVKKESVSKSDAANYDLLRSIQFKHGISDLGFFERRCADSWRHDVLANKFLNMGNARKFMLHQMISFWYLPKTSTLLKVLFAPLGLNLLLFLRSKL